MLPARPARLGTATHAPPQPSVPNPLFAGRQHCRKVFLRRRPPDTGDAASASARTARRGGGATQQVCKHAARNSSSAATSARAAVAAVARLGLCGGVAFAGGGAIQAGPAAAPLEHTLCDSGWSGNEWVQFAQGLKPAHSGTK